MRGRHSVAGASALLQQQQQLKQRRRRPLVCHRVVHAYSGLWCECDCIMCVCLCVSLCALCLCVPVSVWVWAAADAGQLAPKAPQCVCVTVLAARTSAPASPVWLPCNSSLAWRHLSCASSCAQPVLFWSLCLCVCVWVAVVACTRGCVCAMRQAARLAAFALVGVLGSLVCDGDVWPCCRAVVDGSLAQYGRD